MKVYDIEKNDLVKITGNSRLSFKDKQILIVLNKRHYHNFNFSYIEFKLFSVETGRIFYWTNKDNIYEDIVKIKDHKS